MSQTGTPTEFLKLGITEPDDTLNVLVDLNGQWQKIDTGVKNVDTKANTNASGISALNTAVQDNTENITNILETNVNQQTSIDTLQSKVATLEQDDTSYGTRITAVEAGVQENSELINDLEVDLSGVKTSVGTVPSGSNLQGEVNGLDTRVTALENSGSVAAVEARVTTLETEVGSVPAGETVQGQITTLNGQVNSGNIPFRFSVDGGGNYGYLKADDSFVPFRSGSGDNHWHELDTTLYHPYYNYGYNEHSYIVPYQNWKTQGDTNYGKLHDFINNVDYTLPSVLEYICIVGNIIINTDYHTYNSYLAKNGTLTTINDTICGITLRENNNKTYYLTKTGNTIQYNVVDEEGNSVGLPANYNLRGTPTSAILFDRYNDSLYYRYNNTSYKVTFDTVSGTASDTAFNYVHDTPVNRIFGEHGMYSIDMYGFNSGGHTGFTDATNKVITYLPTRIFKISNKFYFYL